MGCTILPLGMNLVTACAASSVILQRSNSPRRRKFQRQRHRTQHRLQIKERGDFRTQAAVLALAQYTPKAVVQKIQFDRCSDEVFSGVGEGCQGLGGGVVLCVWDQRDRA